jgi:hypothetical protein
LLRHEKQKNRSRRITVDADKAYHTKDFVSTVREWKVTPQVTKNEKGRRSNLDRRTAATGKVTRAGKGGSVVRL